MLYAYAFLILTVLIYFFFTIKGRDFYSFSSNGFYKYSRASPFSAQQQIFSFCIEMRVGFFSPEFYRICSTAHIREREAQRDRFTDIDWVSCFSIQNNRVIVLQGSKSLSLEGMFH